MLDGIQLLPDWEKIAKQAGNYRPETGAMQFGEDWPGIFIRGDEALMGYATMLRRIAAQLDGTAEAEIPADSMAKWLHRFAGLLESCRV